MTKDIQLARVATINLITSIGFYLQIEKVLPEEVEILYAGELEFPPEDPLGEEIDRLDRIICATQALLSDKDITTYLA